MKKDIIILTQTILLLLMSLGMFYGQQVYGTTLKKAQTIIASQQATLDKQQEVLQAVPQILCEAYYKQTCTSNGELQKNITIPTYQN